MNILVLFVIVILSQFSGHSSINNSKRRYVTLISSISSCRGGEVCDVQPIISLVDNLGITISDFNGTAYATLSLTPTGFENMFTRSCVGINCIEQIVDSNVPAPFRNGYAMFEGLMLRTAGSCYALQFLVYDEDGNAVGSIGSDIFNVDVGAMYQLSFSSHVGNAVGGEVFKPNPIIKVADRGFNTISSLNYGVILVWLCSSPYPDENLMTATSYMANVVNGVTVFSGLNLRTAGYPYALCFNSSIEGLIINYLQSQEFTVGVGDVSYMTLTPKNDLPPTLSFLSGSYFSIDSSISLYDAGGNFVTIDSHSYITAVLWRNPGNATLFIPVANIFRAQRGFITLPSFRIDKVGIGYQLIYYLHHNKASALSSPANSTISILSSRFNIFPGEPHGLSIIRDPRGAWAGMQPFSVQPRVAIIDAGGKILDIKSYAGTAKLVSSPGSTKKLTIVANNLVISNIINITTTSFNTSHGVGDILYIMLQSRYEVWVSNPECITLTLNILNNGYYQNASLFNSSSARVKLLTFQYYIQDGDDVDIVNVRDSNALSLGSCGSIVDGNNNGIDLALTLQYLPLFMVAVNTSIPRIISLTVNTSSGEYSTGQVIEYMANYDMPVVVTGKPVLILSGRTYNNESLMASYNECETYDMHSVCFTYVVMKGDSSDMLYPANYTICLNESTFASIKRFSANASTNASLEFDQVPDGIITINTDSPTFNASYGLQTNHSSGIYYAGEVIYISLQFTKSVIVIGDGNIKLLLDVGFKHEAMFSSLSDDNFTIWFKLIVPKDANINSLDIYNKHSILLPSSRSTVIMRLSSIPSDDAYVSTEDIYQSNSSLSSHTMIALNGSPPHITTITLLDISHAELNPDDVIYIQVNFTLPVVCTCNPIIIISVGEQKVASYYQGNETESLVFVYRVTIGDESQGLYLRYFPNALCSWLGCSVASNCNILAYSSSPTLPAILTIPKYSGSLNHKGVLINDSIIINPMSLIRNTSIVSIDVDLESGVYGAGTAVWFMVLFTDIVIVKSTTYPKLYLNIEEFATYVNGSNSNTLWFLYVISANDSTDSLIPTILYGNSSLLCELDSGCSIRNKVHDLVDMSTSAIDLYNSTISLDSTSPHIIGVFIEKEVDYYTVGDSIEFIIIFDREIIVSGPKPKLALLIGSIQRYAVYSDHILNNTKLLFRYTVDIEDDCAYVSFPMKFILLNDDTTKIYLNSPNPIVVANSSFYHITVEYAENGHVADIYACPSYRPIVISVTAMNFTNNTINRVGDSITIEVILSDPIASTGRSYLNLNCGLYVRRAHQIEAMSDGFDMPSSVFHFKYTVEPDDFTLTLDYVDSYSWLPGVDEYGGDGIFLLSPTYGISLELPSPGYNGSISYLDAIIIDGRAPYLSDIKFMNDTGEYGVGETICLALVFSADVMVLGSPSIILNTSPVSRIAEWMRTSIPSKEVIFCYDPQPGDYTIALDYQSTFSRSNSDTSSYIANGASIITASKSPSQEVSFYMNPSGGVLVGELEQDFLDGIISFKDLTISRSGDYEIMFLSEVHSDSRLAPFRISSSIFVSFSNEFELRPAEALHGKRNIGNAVAVKGDIAVVTSPSNSFSMLSVQLVSTYGTVEARQQQIQLFATDIQPSPLIQRFYTTSYPGSSITGDFTITYDTHGTTRPIPYNADESILQSILGYDLPSLGKISVSRESYLFCACSNAYIWTITFLDLTFGQYNLLKLNDSQLLGGNASIVGPVLIQVSAKISGSFRLYVPDLNVSSDEVPYNASSNDMKVALNNLGFGVTAIDVSPPILSRAFTWIVTFGSYEGSYEIPAIEIISSLVGGIVSASTSVLREGVYGPNGLSGYFQLEFRNEMTSLLPYNIDSSSLKLALETLPSINIVEVSRRLTSNIGSYSWRITFSSVNRLTATGYVIDEDMVIDEIVPYNYLIGTHARISVSYDQYNFYNNERSSVYVFQLFDEVWTQTSTLFSNSSLSSDQSLTSVDLSDDVIVLGQPYSRQIQQSAKYLLNCQNVYGSFRLYLSGSLSPLIRSSINLPDLSILLDDSFPSITDLNLVGLRSYDNQSAICMNGSFEISYLSTINDIQYLQLIDVQVSSIDGGSYNLEIMKLQNESFSDTSSSSGSVSIFRSSSTGVTKSNWNQEAELWPLTSNGFELFGYSVALSETVLAIGCPGCYDGEVYVYTYDASSSWMLNYRLSNSFSHSNSFGFSVDISCVTISIGDPTAFDGYGAAYVYTFTDDSYDVLIANQAIVASSIMNTTGSQFGKSVSIDNNTLVIGAPYYSEGAMTSSGAAYVFERISTSFDYAQRLESEVPLSDLSKFGSQVVIIGDTVAVSNVEEYFGDLLPSTAVIRIKTTFSANPKAGSFRLKWKVGTSTSNVWVNTTYTRPISINASSTSLQNIIEEDFNLGSIFCKDSLAPYSCLLGVRDGIPNPIYVSRSRNHEFGYTWDITFAGISHNIPLFEADIGELSSKGTIDVSYVNKPSNAVRGLVHAYKRESTSLMFVEEMLLSPFAFQQVDRCGTSIGLSDSHVIIGCPNRNKAPYQLNSGSAFVHKTEILSASFNNQISVVKEGKVLIESIDAKDSTSFYIRTIDRNSQSPWQNFLGNLYDVCSSDTEYPNSIIDYIGLFGSAIAKFSDDIDPHYVYGSFNARGISDYLPLFDPIYCTGNHNVTITTFPDSLYESPDESFHAVIYSPGMWPTISGHLSLKVQIRDETSNSTFMKLYKSEDSPGNLFGSVVRLHDGIMVVGSKSEGGKASIYQKSQNTWGLYQTLSSPLSYSNNSSNFADDVAISSHDFYTICAIGEPYQSKIHIYISKLLNSDQLFILEASLGVDEVSMPELGFGRFGSTALDGGLLVVGVAGLEAVFIYHRSLVNGTYAWSKSIRLRSRDFDYDIINSHSFIHRQGFGYAVSTSKRTIIVGAPFADYDKLGSNEVEVDWDTTGESIQTYGRGKVYVYESSPTVQVISLLSQYPAPYEKFKLSFNDSGINYVSSFINGSSNDYDMRRVLSEFPNIGTVDVEYKPSFSTNGAFGNVWKISFISKWDNPPLLRALWYGNGCDECSGGNSSRSNASFNVQVSYVSNTGDFVQTQTLVADDRSNGDRFGASLSIEDDTIAIGAPYSSSLSRTTFDFETGDLRGWSSSGVAFMYQPTLGDNSRYRESQDHIILGTSRIMGEPSLMKGSYYIGTYEKHPNKTYDVGSVQGNGPQGTLTSDSFIISGDSISFLIGGGCDVSKISVDLDIDGLTVDRVTGHCSETMKPTKFDVSKYIGRSASIRIVDKSSDDWGHINVDNFESSWNARDQASYLDVNHVDTPKSGAVYVFTKIFNSSGGHSWTHASRIQASDKRQGSLFGSSVKVDSKAGVVIVSAPYAERTGVNNEFLSTFPYNHNDMSFGSSYEQYLVARSSFSSLISGSPRLWYADKKIVDTRLWDNVGAVYIYKRISSVISKNGTVVHSEHWHPFEHTKIQPGDSFAGDLFASSLDIDGEWVAAGSPGNDASFKDSGATYLFNIGFASLYFDQREYSGTEGVDKRIAVLIRRDISVHRGPIVVQYATSDQSAVGVDEHTFNQCMKLAPESRSKSCGDYMHSYGIIDVAEQQSTFGFDIKLMNNHCKNEFARYGQIFLIIPGFAQLQGSKLTAKFRIEEDDVSSDYCNDN